MPHLTGYHSTTCVTRNHHANHIISQCLDSLSKLDASLEPRARRGTQRDHGQDCEDALLLAEGLHGAFDFMRMRHDPSPIQNQNQSFRAIRDGRAQKASLELAGLFEIEGNMQYTRAAPRSEVKN